MVGVGEDRHELCCVEGSEAAGQVVAPPLFVGLSRGELARMASCLDVAHVAPGFALSREGTPADALWLIADGEVELRARNRFLGRVGPGNVLGAAALFATGEAELTAVAVGPVLALVASRVQFNQLRASSEVELRLRALCQPTQAQGVGSKAA